MREQFESQVGSKYEGILEVSYAYQDKNDLPAGFSCPPQRERPWGTGHAVWAARDTLGDSSFAVINADDFYGAETFEVLIDSFQKMDEDGGENIFSMVGFRLYETLSEHGVVSRGICQVSDGFWNLWRNGPRLGELPWSGLHL